MQRAMDRHSEVAKWKRNQFCGQNTSWAGLQQTNNKIINNKDIALGQKGNHRHLSSYDMRVHSAGGQSDLVIRDVSRNRQEGCAWLHVSVVHNKEETFYHL